MDLTKSTHHQEEYTIKVVTDKGHLRTLQAPFQVKCIKDLCNCKTGSYAYVEAVAGHQHCILIYRVLGHWHPYNLFQIKIRF